jgi:hypothetical protein
MRSLPEPFTGIEHLINAFEGVQDLFWLYKKDSFESQEERTQAIIQEAQELLYNNILFPDEMVKYETVIVS